MSNIEKIGTIIGVIIFAFGVGVGWNTLNNRIDRVDEKIEAIQETLGSTTCTAILTRQIEAIEKGRDKAREALEGLSDRYGCVEQQVSMNADMTVNAVDATTMNASVATATNLSAELNAVDVLLNNEN